jgi:hypothetical protein
MCSVHYFSLFSFEAAKIKVQMKSLLQCDDKFAIRKKSKKSFSACDILVFV